ncbi:MAG: heme-copper oxidase subunit III [Alphaproteobacteria bacterium]|nr:heme-copper oxidase subunit III [Alphaproteobacteria bacterium]MBV9152763.1 heme-copper oxidase subunit III [Alphaproteobacteria bacterium]
MSDVFPYRPPLPMGSIGLRSSGFWGMAFLVLSEASLFAYLFFSYFYFSVQPHPGPWPPSGPPDLSYALGQTATALIGCGTMWWADRSAAVADRSGLLLGLGASLALVVAFIVLQFLDWYAKPFSLATDPYGSLYFTTTGVHLGHVVAGLIMMAAVLLWSLLGYFGPVRHAPVTITAFYWYFVAVIWLAVFFTLYITPYLA